MNADAVAITEFGFHLDENNNFHIAGIFPAQGAKAFTVESPLIKQLPRGHRQFISLLDDQGVTLTEALLSAEHDLIDVDMPKRPAEEIQPPARTPRPASSFLWAWNTFDRL